MELADDVKKLVLKVKKKLNITIFYKSTVAIGRLIKPRPFQREKGCKSYRYDVALFCHQLTFSKISKTVCY